MTERGYFRLALASVLVLIVILFSVRITLARAALVADLDWPVIVVGCYSVHSQLLWENPMATRRKFLSPRSILLRMLLWLPAIVCLGVNNSSCRDLGQWETSDPAIREWYQSLMQPDAPMVSCCGEADAYWADEIHVRDGRTFATITDDRPDEPRGWPHVDVGTEIEIPNNKLKWDKSNPTGHGVVFMSRNRYVFCFVQPGGV